VVTLNFHFHYFSGVDVVVKSVPVVGRYVLVFCWSIIIAIKETKLQKEEITY